MKIPEKSVNFLDMKKIIIAIDGPAGSGKSTTAKLVAEKMNYLYIDTGAMYRAVTYMAMEKNILEDTQAIVDLLQKSNLNLSYENSETRVFIGDEEVTEQIRSKEVNDQVSYISTIAGVRRQLVQLQQHMGNEGGVVMEGRDIGTVVYPHAELKIFMVAALDTRAERRLREFEIKGKHPSFTDVKDNLAKRDNIDSSRTLNPLVKAEGAVEVDTTHLTIEEQVDFIVKLAKKRVSQGSPDKGCW